MTKRLEGKVALITGASRGVGLEDAKLFAAEGATVIMADINVETGQKTAVEIGDSAEFAQLDVSNEQNWKELIATIDKQYGKLDILVNNAAILQVGLIDTETLEGWRRLQSINTEGVFLGIQNALPLMEKSGGGSIINMCSSSAHFGMPNFIAYSASKGAVKAMTQAIAVHCHQQTNNVRCNCILPDGIATDMTMEITQHLDELEGDKAMQAMSYMSMPEEIAKTVLFLASDDSSNINGASIKTDKSATVTPPYA